MRRFVLPALLLACAAVLATQAAVRHDAPAGMVWIPGGEFTMGSDGPRAHPAEQPAHRVRLNGFWKDATDVTNAPFRSQALHPPRC
jgi:formylglycine-generating enzyme required for sulfatase activity